MLQNTCKSARAVHGPLHLPYLETETRPILLSIIRYVKVLSAAARNMDTDLQEDASPVEPEYCVLLQQKICQFSLLIFDSPDGGAGQTLISNLPALPKAQELKVGSQDKRMGARACDV